MERVCKKHFLEAGEIQDPMEIRNRLLRSANAERVQYHVTTDKKTSASRHAVFYLHGLGGRLSDVPFLEDFVCPHAPLIRVANFGLRRVLLARCALATFGDVCVLMHNTRQSLLTIADRLGLESYDVVAHSWGGMVGCITALRDHRCRKAMLLTSTGDICDAIHNMYELARLPRPIRPLADLFMGKMRWQAAAAMAGCSRHQAAWERISPYGEIVNRDVELLFFNRIEDRLMRRVKVEQFVDHARRQGLARVSAEFIAIPERRWHDMPLASFGERLREFLWAS